MLTPSIFRPDEAEIARMIGEYPFGLLISSDNGRIDATPLPLLLEKDAAGTLHLLGHFGAGNPQIGALRKSPRALVVYLGVNGYISPSWMADRTQAPTWNYETAHLVVDVHINGDPDAARHAVDRLTTRMEDGRPNAWNSREMGERYDRLVRGVVAFEARIVEVASKFKLGQNERIDVLRDIIEGLRRTGSGGLCEAMVRANVGRLPIG